MQLHLFKIYGALTVDRKLTDLQEGIDVDLLAGYFIELNSSELLMLTLGS